MAETGDLQLVQHDGLISIDGSHDAKRLAKWAANAHSHLDVVDDWMRRNPSSQATILPGIPRVMVFENEESVEVFSVPHHHDGSTRWYGLRGDGALVESGPDNTWVVSSDSIHFRILRTPDSIEELWGYQVVYRTFSNANAAKLQAILRQLRIPTPIA